MVLHLTASSGTSLSSLSTISVASERDLDYGTLLTHHISENTSHNAEWTVGGATGVKTANSKPTLTETTVAETTDPETAVAETTVAETTTGFERTGAEISGSVDDEHNGYCLNKCTQL